MTLLNIRNCLFKVADNICLYLFPSSPRTWRDIVALDKWEILPEQIEYEEELGRGAFGVVHKAKLNKRVGIEVFDTRKQLEEEKRKKAFQVVAVKVLKGNF